MAHRAKRGDARRRQCLLCRAMKAARFEAKSGHDKTTQQSQRRQIYQLFQPPRATPSC